MTFQRKPVNLCQHILPCFGCCGHSYTNRADVTEAIRKNTLELKRYKNPKDFMNRSNNLRACGLCRNVVFLSVDWVGCPLHPDILGKDIRVGHCDTKYRCKTKKLFSRWKQKKKEKFLDFLSQLKEEGMDWYDYSIGMDNDSILKKFLENK